MKKWKVTAEINMDASDYRDVIVKANTKRKAQIFAEDTFKKSGAFYINILKTELISNDNHDKNCESKG